MTNASRARLVDGKGGPSADSLGWHDDRDRVTGRRTPYERIGARGLAIPGVVVVSAGWWFMTTFSQHTSVWVVLATYVAVCAGQAFAWVAIFTMSLGSLPSALTAHGSAALNTVQQLAGAAGLAVLIAVLSAYAGGTDAAAIAHGARAAFTVGAIIALVALVTTFFLPRHRARAGLPAT
jgi:MFS transporter, DHA2 family, lincomycin resistance protein